MTRISADVTTKTETGKTRGRVRIEEGAKRVRAYLGGEVVADTTHPMLVWEKPYYPPITSPSPTCAPSCSKPTAASLALLAAATVTR
jgi:hypothetical protein